MPDRVFGRVGRWSHGRKVGQLEESSEGEQLHVFCSLWFVMGLSGNAVKASRYVAEL